MDIVETAEGSQTGYLAVDPLEYAQCLAAILYGTKQENDTIRAAARLAHFSHIVITGVLIEFIL